MIIVIIIIFIMYIVFYSSVSLSPQIEREKTDPIVYSFCIQMFQIILNL